MRRILVIAIVVTLLAASPSLACSCGFPLQVPEALEKAAAVFVGRVMAVKIVEAKHFDSEVDEDLIVTLRTSRAWKGISADRLVEVRTVFSCCRCGFDFEIGRGYLLFTCAHDGELYVSSCSISEKLERAGREIEASDEIATPEP